MHNINLLKNPKQLYQSQYQLPPKIRMSMSFSFEVEMVYFYFDIFIYLYTGIYYKPCVYAIYDFNMQHNIEICIFLLWFYVWNLQHNIKICLFYRLLRLWIISINDYNYIALFYIVYKIINSKWYGDEGYIVSFS